MASTDSPQVYAYGARDYCSYFDARWAAFFDQVGWPYTRLDPARFVLQFRHPVHVLVVSGDISVVAKYIRHDSPDSDLVLVGNEPDFDNHVLGLMNEAATRSAWGDWEKAPLMWCLLCGRLSFYHAMSSYHCRVNLCHDGDHHISSVSHATLRGRWRAASQIAALSRVVRGQAQ